jgi:outer membrane protein assembly factor BamB
LDVTWWHILGNEQAPKSFGQLKPVVYQDLAYVALADGAVFAVDLEGEYTEIGRHAAEITAPLTVSDEQILVTDADGIVTLYTMGLIPIWSLNVGALSTESALLTEGRVFVQTIDGRVSAIERITGRLLWSFQDAEPRLTLTGTSSPILISTNRGDAIVTGLANGKLTALSVLDGSVVWEYRITRASGKTDVSRLVDVDAQATLVDGRLVASSYQGDLIVVETATGRVLQAKPFSTYRSILVDGETWFGVNAQSHVVSVNSSTLEENWTNESFEYRELSELVLLEGNLFATDKKGFLHVLDAQSGEWLASRHVDWRGAKTDPVVFGNGVLVQGYSTRLKLLEAN